MKIVFHPRFTEVYASDPASNPGRIEAILDELQSTYDFVEPREASEKDLRRVHTQYHIDWVKRDGLVYDMACMAAGAAINAAQLAVDGEASFGLLRPPGHHAGSNQCWGFCYFNNIAVALARLLDEKIIENALILDFDLHFGDGSDGIFEGSSVKYFHPDAISRDTFMGKIARKFEDENDYSILAISAGFDRHVQDWGRLLTTDDYRTIGRLSKEASEQHCQGRRFAVLEGGYNHGVLGKNVRAFVEGLD
jgi:acetoin utilization deacetylase AcuC-like enzyme